MDWFHYRDAQLCAEEVNLDDLAAKLGTPAYVYSRRTFEHHYDAVAKAFASLNPLICYSIKSCSNIHILQMLARQGAGMDVVSGGELYRAQQAGVPARNIVYAGVGKTDQEIREAVEAGIGWFNIESEQEFENISRIAADFSTPSPAPAAALRVNPDVDPETHAKTTTGKKETKFGVDLDRARRFFEQYGHDPHLRLNALHVHIGSPVYSVEPYIRAMRKVMELIDELRREGYTIDAIDLGGGFGADYQTEQTPPFENYAERIAPLLEDFVSEGGKVILEPGRSIAANAGMLLTRVQYVKTGGRRKFIIVDSGMNHLMRPTLYDAFHFIWPTRPASGHIPEHRHEQMPHEGLESCDVVGPICETGDYFAKARPLPPLARRDLLAVFSAGAYGMAMANQYNSFPRPPEVLVSGDEAEIIRRRETYEDLIEPERNPQPIGVKSGSEKLEPSQS